jgi:HTH-type transcriptional regulator, competence development regulator
VPISPTYLSKIERDEFPPPAERTICRIAELLDQNSDEFLALAGKIASDLRAIIRGHPREMAGLVRAMRGLSAEHSGNVPGDLKLSV